MNRIILIRDRISDKEENKYIKTTMPCRFNLIDANENISGGIHEEYHDITELLVEQIVSSTVTGYTIKNIYIMDSMFLYAPHNTYSSKTIRYFVRKGKEKGDVFLFVGSDITSKLIAKLWGFKQVKLLKK